jgi:hypothetical protein
MQFPNDAREPIVTEAIPQLRGLFLPYHSESRSRMSQYAYAPGTSKSGGHSR